MDNGRRNMELDFMGHRAVGPVINKSGKTYGNSKCLQKSRFLVGGLFMACWLVERFWQTGILLLLEGVRFAIMGLKTLSI
jgi:hypothetical protein